MLLVSPVLFIASQNIYCEKCMLFIQIKTLSRLRPKHNSKLWLMQNSNQYYPPVQQEHKIPLRITGVHVWQMLAGSAAVSSSSLLKATASVVWLLSCYWAVNSADGSCLCVLIRSVTLNLGIDTWGDAERGKSGNLPTLNYDIHRWCHNRGTGGFETHSSSRDWIHLFELCMPNTHTLKHTPRKGFPS